jgi:hypothetical protein
MLKDLMKSWKIKNDWQKVQGVYLALVIAGVITAGLFALIDQEIGLAIFDVAKIGTIILIVNTVIWSLVRANEAPEQSKSQKRKN